MKLIFALFALLMENVIILTYAELVMVAEILRHGARNPMKIHFVSE